MENELQRQGVVWQALEYHHFEKSSDWYWILGIVAVTVTVLCILFGNILFGVFIILASIVGGVYAGRAPEIVESEISTKGIRFHKTFYPFDTLDSFWIEEEDVHPKIVVKSKKTLMTQILIPLGDMPADEIRAILLEYIPEIRIREPFLHKLLEYFGF